MTWVPRVCTRGCAVQHIENCPKCFGIGVRKTNPETPISFASLEEALESGNWMPCTVCRGTPKGMPKEA